MIWNPRASSSCAGSSGVLLQLDHVGDQQHRAAKFFADATQFVDALRLLKENRIGTEVTIGLCARDSGVKSFYRAGKSVGR